MLTKQAPVHVKAVGPDDGLEEGVFEAIVSVFGNVDSYGDRVMPGAFAKTLTEWADSGDPIPVYWSHRMDDPDYNIGHVLEAAELLSGDERLPDSLKQFGGLWVKVQIDLEDGTTSKAKQVYRLLKGRRVTQFSFAYDVMAYRIVKAAEDAESVWELDELALYEVGPTPIGANQETELLSVKAAAHHAQHLTEGIKAGRVLSAKNETELRDAHEAIGRVLSTLNDDSEDDSSKASGSGPAKDEEPTGAKSEEPIPSTPVDAVLTHLELASAELELIES